MSQVRILSPRLLEGFMVDERKKGGRGGARKGAGRPPKDPSEVLDDELQVPCKREDKERWKARATAAELSLAAWARAKLG